MPTKFTRWVLVAAMLALVSGCAKPDWIQQTLVTVDVTGVWKGTGVRSPSGPLEVQLELEQHGPKVTGNILLTGYAAQSQVARSGRVEGAVEGDVFRFHQTEGTVLGEMTVAGDEMTGSITASTTYQVGLHRASSEH